MRDGTIRKGQDGRARPGLLVIKDGYFRSSTSGLDVKGRSGATKLCGEYGFYNERE
jgi:hypothetical protein